MHGWMFLFLLTVAPAGGDTLLLSGPRRSPAKAVLLSAFLPGGGQFYTHQPVKGGVLGGAELYTGYAAFQAFRRTLQALDRYHRTGQEEDRQDYLTEQQKALYWFFWWLTFWGYSLADAYVSAHLYQIELQIQEIERHTVSLRVGFSRSF